MSLTFNKQWYFYAIAGGLLFSSYGWLPCLQHVTLRCLLWWGGATPWNYATFLNYASELRLLQKLGGRYRFVHDLLREHLIADA